MNIIIRKKKRSVKIPYAIPLTKKLQKKSQKQKKKRIVRIKKIKKSRRVIRT